MNYPSFNTHQRHKECPSRHESEGWLLFMRVNFACATQWLLPEYIWATFIQPSDFIAEILLTPEHIIFCSCHVCSDRYPTLMRYPTFPSISTLQKYQNTWSIVLVIYIPFYFAHHFSNNNLFSICIIGWIYLWNSSSQVLCDILLLLLEEMVCS